MDGDWVGVRQRRFGCCSGKIDRFMVKAGTAAPAFFYRGDELLQSESRVVSSGSSGPAGSFIFPLAETPPPVPRPMMSGSRSPPLEEPGPDSLPPTPLVRVPSEPARGWVAPGSARLVFSDV